MIKNFNNIKNKGYVLIQVIVFGAIAVYILGALTGWAVIDIKASKQAGSRELSIQIAEAGIDYYRWHLAHAPTDYQDGMGVAGPYVHDFYDKDDNKIGTFTLSITPPLLGSSLVIVKSTGKTVAEPDITRTIQAKFAKPSMAKYAVAANDVMRFGEGTEIFGPIHSNKGIRFDGLIHNVITSSVAGYDDPDHSDGANEFGVHTHVKPPPQTGVYTDFVAAEAPPATIPSRPDVFAAGRQFPVPEVDFTGITADIAQMKTDAVAHGYWKGDSGKSGYHIVLKTNDTFDLYKVTKLNTDCADTWSIKTESFIENKPFPTNGLIFLEDDVWVDGQINSARLTIVAAVLPDDPATRKNITINNDLLYTNYDGRDVIGLIAQNNINVGLISDDNLQIDAALIAQKGRVGRFYYSSNCSNTYYKRQTLTLNGMLATNLRYGFTYISGSTYVSGYATRNLNYDGDLLYSPPPSFPLTSDQYVTISWEEIK